MKKFSSAPSELVFGHLNFSPIISGFFKKQTHRELVRESDLLTRRFASCRRSSASLIQADTSARAPAFISRRNFGHLTRSTPTSVTFSSLGDEVPRFEQKKVSGF